MKNSDSTFPLFFTGVLLLCFVPYFINCFYIFPAADDFSYAFLGSQRNLYDAWIGEYQTWNGRYFSNLFVLNNPIKYNSLLVYKLVPALLIATSVLSVYFLLKEVFRNQLSSAVLCNVSLIFNLLYLNNMPIISEGLYWYTAAVTYHLANILSVFFIVFLIRFLSLQYFINRAVHLVLLCLLLISIEGCNEVSMAITVFTMVLLSLFFYYYNNPQKHIIVLLTVVSIMGAIVVFGAPGNEVRSQNFNNNKQFFYSVYMASLQTIRFLIQWIINPSFIIVNALFIFLYSRIKKLQPLFFEKNYLHPLISNTILVFFLFIGSFPAYWGTGIMGQHRTMNVSYWMFLLFWFVNLSILLNYFNLNFKTYSVKSRTLLIVVLVCCLLFTNNSYYSITDLTVGKSQLYHAEMLKRDSMLKNTKQPTDTVFFSKIENAPKSIFVIDITADNSEHWLNRCYNLYYQISNPVLLKNTDASMK